MSIRIVTEHSINFGDDYDFPKYARGTQNSQNY